MSGSQVKPHYLQEMFMSSNLTAAENLAQSICQVAKKAHTEEDLRVGVEQALSTTLQALGLAATPEYEWKSKFVQ